MNELGITGNTEPTDSFATVADVPVAATTDRISPNQVASGVTRGTQTVVGSDSSSITTGVVPNSTRLGVAQYDSTGKLISEVGQQADGSNGLKFFDANGVGIALFGKFADGSIALKVAKNNVEVGSATNDQLVFNSAQNVFKIAKKLPASLPSFPLIVGPPKGGYTSVAVPHGLGFAPIVQAYAQGQLLDTSNNLIATSYIPLPIYIPANAGGSYINTLYWFPGVSGSSYPLTIVFGVDATNIYVEAVCQTSAADTVLAIPLTLFCLQETAA